MALAWRVGGVVFALLLSASTRATCTTAHIAGEYASSFGPMACSAAGDALQCCYEDLRGCSKKLELTLQPGARELRGRWFDAGSSGAAKFAVDERCNLGFGRWGTGSTATQRWTINGRTAPAALPPPAPLPKHLVNFRGELLHAGDGFDVTGLVSNPRDPDGWCDALAFRTSVEFDRRADFLFDPEYLYETLYAELLPRLKRERCPGAQQSISANVYLKNVFFNRRGETTSREAVLEDGAMQNAPLVTVSYHAAFDVQPDAQPGDASQLNYLYNDTGVHRARLPTAQVARLVGSADRLREYYERGGKTPDEYAVIQGRKAAVEARFQQVADQYGVRPQSYDVVRILTGNGDELNWVDFDRWYFLRSYIQTTTRLCGDRTVGEPYRSESYFANERGERVADGGVVLWYSTELRPSVKGRQIGSALFGVYAPDEKIAADVAALVQMQGCASEPLARLERFFH